MKTVTLPVVTGVLLASVCVAQTQIDLMRQTRNVDFSQASRTKTVRTGAATPAVCEVGELFFRTTAASGRNLYLCVALNTWAPVEGSVTSMFGRAGAVQAAEGDYTLARLGDVDGKHGSAAMVQMFGGGSSSPGDCVTFDTNGNLVSTGAPCGGLTSMQAGAGLTITGTSPKTFSVNSATVPTFLTAMLTVANFAVPAFSCAERTIAVPGAGLDDAVAPGWPSGLPGGITGVMRVTGAGVVSMRVCNITAGEINLPAGTYRATVVRSF